MPTRVLHLITELDTGGAQKALARLLAHLDRERFTPHVACLYNGDRAVAQEIRSLGIPVIDLGMTAKWRADAMGRLYRLLRRVRPTILHTWMFHANVPGRVLGRLAGVPIIIGSERTMGQEAGWRYRLNRWTHPLADRIVCVSQQVADFVVGHANTPREKTVVIHNGVDLRAFHRSITVREARSSLGLPLDAAIAGTVTRLSPVKRLDVLIQAVGSLPDVHSVIVGDGSQQAPLVRMADQLDLGSRVHFVGHQQDVRPWLAAFDVFVLPSDWEGMSNALLEAMAASLPVVATRVGGTPEVVVEGVTGLLVPPGDPRSLARAVHHLLSHPHVRREMGKAGRARVEQSFLIEQTVRDTEQLYTEMLARKGL